MPTAIPRATTSTAIAQPAQAAVSMLLGRLGATRAYLWHGPRALASGLETEWRLVAVRWAGIGLMGPGLAWLPLTPGERLAAYAVLVFAALYNLCLHVLMPRRPRVFASGYVTTVGDGLLNVAMITLGGGFASPLYGLLNTVTIASAMRYGYGPTALVTLGFLLSDLVHTTVSGAAPGGAYIVRSGFLIITAALASYLRGQARRLEQSLEHQLARARHDALYDRLTGLPNRRLLIERVDLAVAASARVRGDVAVLLIDIDRFAAINDTFGYAYGDGILRQIGHAVSASVASDATVARVSGDAFAVVLPETSGTGATRVAEKLLRVLEHPRQVDGVTVDVSASIGIALAPSDGTHAEVLLQHATSAMQWAKQRRGDYARYIPRRDLHTPERMALAVDLRRAVERGELRVVYQPIVCARTAQIEEVEALVRWLHPVRGPISPAEFIPIAEETGMINAIGQWVLAAACRQVAEWRREVPGAASLAVSVNLSPRQMQRAGMVDEVRAVLDSSGLEPAALKLEVTESVAMADVEWSIATLWMLKGIGVRLAIDDFGTGYSSLGYIKRIPADTLKVDKGFVDGLGIHPEDSAIVAAIIAFAHSVGMSTTVEGVENEQQVALLRELGADRLQGYYYSAPRSGEDLRLFLEHMPRAQTSRPVLVHGGLAAA